MVRLKDFGVGVCAGIKREREQANCLGSGFSLGGQGSPEDPPEEGVLFLFFPGDGQDF